MSSNSDSDSSCDSDVSDTSDNSLVASTDASCSERSSGAHSAGVADAETLVRMTKLVSLRGFGGTTTGTTPFTYIPTRARDDERWLIALLSSPACYRQVNESLHAGADSLEVVLRQSAPGFSEAFTTGRSTTRPCVERHRLLVATDSAPVVGNARRHQFFERTVAAPEKPTSAKPQTSRSTNVRKGIKVVVVPDAPTGGALSAKHSSGVMERTVTSWDGHMRAVAAAQGSSVHQLRQESQAVKRFSDTEAFIGQAEAHEYNEQLRLEAIARDQEERRNRRKRERTD